MTTVRKIAIIGCGGAGKSTLAHRLGDVLGLPVVHLDQHYWRPGWVEPDKATFHAQLAELLAADAWVLDGNYSGTLEVRAAAADVVVFLDFPRALCLYRVFARWWRWRGHTRPDLADLT